MIGSNILNLTNFDLETYTCVVFSCTGRVISPDLFFVVQLRYKSFVNQPPSAIVGMRFDLFRKTIFENICLNSWETRKWSTLTKMSWESRESWSTTTVPKIGRMLVALKSEGSDLFATVFVCLGLIPAFIKVLKSSIWFLEQYCRITNKISADRTFTDGTSEPFLRNRRPNPITKGKEGLLSVPPCQQVQKIACSLK